MTFPYNMNNNFMNNYFSHILYRINNAIKPSNGSLYNTPSTSIEFSFNSIGTHSTENMKYLQLILIVLGAFLGLSMSLKM